MMTTRLLRHICPCGRRFLQQPIMVMPTGANPLLNSFLIIGKVSWINVNNLFVRWFLKFSVQNSHHLNCCSNGVVSMPNGIRLVQVRLPSEASSPKVRNGYSSMQGFKIATPYKTLSEGSVVLHQIFPSPFPLKFRIAKILRMLFSKHGMENLKIVALDSGGNLFKTTVLRYP